MLLCIEGIDGSGKGTITKLLKEHFDRAGKKTQLFSFPAYGKNAWSELIGKYLDGQFGRFPIEVQASLFALERLHSKEELKAALACNDIVFCDRYVPSNLAYAAAGVEREREQQIIKLILDLEYEKMGLTRPDGIVFMDMPLDLAISNVAKKQERRYTKNVLDLLERQRELLHNVAGFYAQMQQWHPDAKFLRVDCTTGEKQDDLRYFPELVSEVVSFIQSFLE